jgi:cysteine-rich repeat protein
VFKIRQEKKLWNISNKSLVTIKASLVIAVLIGLVVFVASVLPAFADGGALVWTTDYLGNDKTDFEPGDIVYIYGTGFNPVSQIDISVIRPDTVTESCNAFSCYPRFLNGLQNSDAEGDFVYHYDLNGIVGEYNVNVTDGTNSAQTTFTDARTITGATLDGGSSVTVARGASITAAVTVQVTSPSEWKSTRYRIGGGSWVCVDTPDHPYGSTYTESFSITAPSDLGTYNVDFEAYFSDSCGTAGSNTYTLTDGITVACTVSDECDADSDCGTGNTCLNCECYDCSTNLLNDGFESGLGSWSLTSSGYTQASDQKNSGTYSAKLASSLSSKFMWTSKFDTSSSSIIFVSFYNRDDDLDPNDIQLYYNNSTNNWDSIADLNEGTEHSWIFHSYSTTNSQYLHKGFAIRIGGTTQYNENHWIDDVLIKNCSAISLAQCGNNNVEPGEQCELPSTTDNSYCTQSTQECSGGRLGTRDSLGNCDANCGCVSDSFTYQCVVGQCGATCDEDSDCPQGQTCGTQSCQCEGTVWTCGNGIIEGSEQCDDGNQNSGDGCSYDTCQIENGWSCTGQPSVCKTINQNLTSSCGIDMVLIIDSSGSIDSSHLTTMKNAFKNFTDAFLPNTPTQIAVVDFDNLGNLVQDYTSDVTSIKNAIDSATTGGNTNWEDGLKEAYDEFDNRVDKPDLYVFASDGNPNRIGDTSSTSVSESVAVAAAVVKANQIKLSGIRIITLGIGSSVNSANLIAISSADAYYSTGFDTLAQTLAALADDLCGGTITVKKLVDGKPASGWQFSTSVTGGISTPSSSTTGADGFINPVFDINISDTTATVDVTETSQGGFGFVSASCKYQNDNLVGTPGTGTVTGITVGKNDAIYCEFNNTAHQCDDDNDCNSDYKTCDGNNVTKHDVYCDKNDYTCKETTSLEQNCDDNDDTRCYGTERWLDDYYCNNGACDTSSQKLEDCNNGLWCDGLETCDDSKEPAICVSETPVNCDDSVSCTVDSCNESTDRCDNIPTDSLCDNGFWCDGVETCDATLGCLSGTPVDCSKLNGQCQAGVCNENTDKCEADYTNYPFSTSCDDGQYCSETDHCDGNGNCIQLNARNCDDQDICTIDSCDETQDECVNPFSDTIGPTTSGTAVNPVFNNGNFNVTALANDTCSNIKKSEYFLGHSSIGFCGIPGTGASMDATDGLFDELIEALKKDNVLYNVFDGLNWICIQSQDNATNWGNCDCAYFDTDTLPPDCSYDIYLDQTLYPKEYLICGNNAWLNATVCDEQSNIQGGEYFVDFNFTNAVPAPWSGTWMNVLYEFDRPSDGHHCAILGALVNTSNLSDGTHYIKLRGKDTVENWGKIIQCKNVSFIKDTKPPITNKTLIPAEKKQHTCEAGEITGANLPVNVSLTDGCQFVKTGTQIVLHAKDQDTPDHEFADKVRIHWVVWYKVNPTDPWVVNQSGVGGEEEDVTITLNSDSYHLIEYWAVDSCGWEETHHFELDIVDNKPPVLTKDIGEPKVPVSFGEWYINQSTTITLNCVDDNPHPSDHVTAYYRYNVDGGSYTDWITYERPFHFTEDSLHVLEYKCVDILDNTAGPYIETDHVDTVPPTTNKTYGTPLVTTNGDYPKWIKSSTPITLTAVDGGAICHIGVNKTYWRNTIVDDRNCLSDYDCQMYAQGSGTFTEYTGQFTKPTESCHLIEYYSVDFLGNAEPVKKQCVYVENTPPVIDKTVDEPKHNCTQEEWEQYGNPDFGCWYITNHTKITLNCSDVQPHPVNNVTLYWKDYLLGETAPAFTPVQGGYAEITKEDSEHVLEFYCEDALGNSNGLHKEIDIVDTKPPVINKTIGGPNHTCEGGEGCDYYITKQTPITLTCTDQDPHPVDHEVIYWRYQLNNNGTWFDFSHQGTQVTFTFPEDSNHTLEYWCEDALHNTAQKQTEIDIVDTQNPRTWKVLGGLNITCQQGEGCDYWITQNTMINLYCEDRQPHPVDHEEIYYRYFVDGQLKQNWTQYINPFHYNEDSNHTLEWYCVDVLGNEETYVEVDRVDTTPPVINKTIGDPKVPCDPQDPSGCEYWLMDDVTPITINPYDNETFGCAVDQVQCEWWYIWEGNTYGPYPYDNPIIFTNDTVHELHIKCRDALGNEKEDVEVFRVDSIAPETIKTFREITVNDTIHGPNYWLRDHVTVVELNATDYQDPCAVGVDYIHVELWNETVNDGGIDNLIWYRDIPGNYYEFTIDEDCLHEIRWYAVDKLGNQEQEHTQQHRVDSTPPVTAKTIEGPTHPASQEDIDRFGLQGDDITNFWIRDHVTNITLDATDYTDPCDVGVKEVHYRICLDNNKDNQFTEDECNPWIVVQGAHTEFTINEDCLHKIEWYAVDMLGNQEQTHVQYHRVDSTPPESNKTIGDPKWWDENLGLWWVKSNTQFILTAVDKQDPCSVGVDYLHVKIEWDSNCDGSVDYSLFEDNISASQYDFTLGQYYHPGETNECLHKITWYAVDKLGNEEIPEVQYHKVDDTPPHILILKPVDGWYSDGEDIPIVSVAEDLTNPHGPCDPFSGMCNVGIENGRQCYAYLIDILPHFQVRDLQTEGTLLYNAESHECQGYATIPNPSGLPDGIAFLAVSADDNLGNMGDSLMEILHAIAMKCECEEDNIYYCPQSCIVDVLQDIVTIWNLPKIGIDNNPIDVTITEPLEGTVLKGTPFNVSANISDSTNGEITSAITTGTPCYITLGGVSLGSVPYINEERKCSGTMVIPSSMPQGLHELKVEIADNAGNIGFGVINVIHDTIPPTDVTIWKDDEKKDLYYDQDGDYTLHWKANDANLDYYELFEKGISIYNTTENNTLFVDKVDGTYEYYVIAHDMGGWSTESNEITVIVDSQNPDIEITGTVPGIGFFIATYTVSDPAPSSGIDRIEVTDTNGYALCSGTSPNGFCTVFLGSELELTVYDKAGNSDTDSTSGTEKDITPPTIIYSSPSGVIAYSDVSLQVKTDEPSICYYGENDDLAGMTLMNASEGNLTHTATLGTLTDGYKVYHVLCEDLAGNKMDSSKTIVFYIDTTGNYNLAIPDYGHYWSLGWNTFFLPKDMLDDICCGEILPCNKTYPVEDVLSSLDGSNPSFDMIWYFDGVDWLWYDPTFSGYQLLTEFNDEQSLPYYIRMIREDRLEITQDICPV